MTCSSADGTWGVTERAVAKALKILSPGVEQGYVAKGSHPLTLRSLGRFQHWGTAGKWH